ncbi:hypothetical protein C5167_050291 [Papaver somniferum]|uniref:Uncharacterized protein n=1 Tax=Papaver somniferum TaxID=3469 RepID=A0A4Y7KRR1_PAPSO|nr:hypothetical protein C5167_050291 [Papaver somniferum]
MAYDLWVIVDYKYSFKDNLVYKEPKNSKDGFYLHFFLFFSVHLVSASAVDGLNGDTKDGTQVQFKFAILNKYVSAQDGGRSKCQRRQRRSIVLGNIHSKTENF